MAKRKPKKTDDIETTTAELDEDLLDEFSDRIEEAINKVCAENSELDPRLELLVTLSLFAAQVGIDTGYDKEEFLSLMEDMYKDSLENNDTEEDEEEKLDTSKLN